MRYREGVDFLLWAGERGLVRMPTFSPLPSNEDVETFKGKRNESQKTFFFPFFFS